MEPYLSLAFMIFALGFFTVSMRIISRDHREAWEQRMMEAREFGVGGRNQEDTQTSNEK